MAKNTETRRVQIIAEAGQADASINKLRAASRLLYNDLQKLPKGSKEFADAMEKWRGIDERFKQAQREVKGLDTEMGKLNKTSSGFWGQIKQIGAGVAVGNFFTALGAEISSLVNTMIQGRTKIDDELRDIAKSTGMTVEQAKELNKELSKIDTRTSSGDLRKLAYEAGKLGKTGKQEVAKFVEEMDKIKVALGDDLGEEAIIQIGKMVNVYDAGAMNIASAINSIGAASEASEQYLVDFASRMGGAARTAKISAPDVIGFAAVLDQMGLNVEMSATALSNFTLNFVKDTAGFEKAAGMRAGSLKKIIGEKGTNEGMLAFIEAMRTSSKSEAEFLQRMEQVGIDGSRGAAVFLTLANNIEVVKEQQTLANAEFTKGTSVLQEFNTKNEGFAANWEKIKKAVLGFFTDNILIDGLESFVNWMMDSTSEADKLVDAFEGQQKSVNKLQREMLPLLDRYDFLKSKTTLNKDEQKELREIIEQVGLTIPGAISQFDNYGNAMEINGGKARQFIKDQALALKSMNRDAITALKEQMKERDGVIKKYVDELKYLKDDPRSISGSQFLSPAELAKRMDANFSGRYKVLQPMIEALRKMNLEDAARMKQLTGEDILAAAAAAPGKQTTGGGAGGGTGVVNQTTVNNAKATAKAVVKTWQQTIEEEFEVSKDSLKAWKQSQELVINEAYIKGEITKKQHTQQLETLDLQYLENLKQVYLDYGKNTTDVEKDIQDVKIKGLEKIAKYLEENPELTEPIAPIGESTASGDNKGKKTQKRNANAWDFTGAAQTTLENAIALANQREDIELRADKKIMDEKLKNLDRMHEQGLISEEYYQLQKNQIEEEYDKKAAEVKRKQWERQKAAAISQALINIAQGVTSALTVAPPAGFILAGLVGAAGALQIAKIAQEPVPEFADGGSTVDVQGQSGRRYKAKRGGPAGYYSSPTYVVGEAGGELIIPNWLYRAPQAMNYIGALEASIAQRSTAPLGGNGAADKMMLGTLAKLNEKLDAGININWDQVGYNRYQDNWSQAEDLARF